MILKLKLQYFGHLMRRVASLEKTLMLGAKIAADGDCSLEIKRCLLLGRKAIINLDSIFKSRDITLPTKVHLVKAMVFPLVIYGCESWTIKKAEHRRIDAFELWCWWSHHFMGNRWGNSGNSVRLYFGGGLQNDYRW